MNNGNYEGTPKEYCFGVSSRGNEYVKLDFDVTHPEGCTRLSYFGYFTDGTAARTIESLRCCGWTGDDLSKPLDGFGSQKVRLVVENETYEGKTRLRIKWVNSTGGSNEQIANQLDGRDLKVLAIRLADKVKMAKTVSGQPVDPPSDDVLAF